MREIKVLLLYPPEQNWPGTMCKPNGSLAYPYLAASLVDSGIYSEIYDACVGDETDNLDETFYKTDRLPSGMVRTGVSDERILEKVKDFDIIGLTSIFSHQETMVLHCAKIIKECYPEKVIISGGVNAKNRMNIFFDAGVDVICTSESEKTIVDISRRISKKESLLGIPFTAFRHEGNIVLSKGDEKNIVWDLDNLSIPRWDMLPNDRYWKIRRPHGGSFSEGDDLRYAAILTSRGCPFSCAYCHISGETEGSISGNIGKFRCKSDERVIRELEIIRDDLGCKQVFIEDDSIFGKKKRAIRLLSKIKDFGLDVLDVNGINVSHLMKRGQPDSEVIDLLVSVGFKEIVLPFESFNQRIIEKWCSNKWKIKNLESESLIKALKSRGIRVAANYMIGFPDETREEIEETIEFARRNMDCGLDASNFFLVMPLPGTPMFEYCIRNNLLPQDFNIDKMQWMKANMINTVVAPEELEIIRQKAWEDNNNLNHLKDRKSWTV